MAGATNNPGEGSQTYYYTNEQSSRLMFYHDHAWGTTRQDVYIGEAAGYIVRDQTEQDLITAGLIPSGAQEIPLVFMDKTFVDATGTPATNPNHILNTDPTWIWGSPRNGRALGCDQCGPRNRRPLVAPCIHAGPESLCSRLQRDRALWPVALRPLVLAPHKHVLFGPVPNVYYDPDCVPNAGNDYFCQPPEMPGTPNPSWGAEAFLDTPMINGTAYPKLTVAPQKYRFRILNAAHDRFVNLQLYVASPIVEKHHGYQWRRRIYLGTGRDHYG